MSNGVTLDYQIDTAGASAATIAACMQAVPVPADILQAAGLRVTSDVITVASPVLRSIQMSFVPSTSATASATLDNEGRISEVTVTAPGQNYVLPPRVTFDDGGDHILSPALATAFLRLQKVLIVSGGVGYSPSTFAAVLGGMAPPTNSRSGTFPPSCVQGLRIAVTGKGYSPATQIAFDGGLDSSDPNARPAQAVITAFGPHGEIVSVQLTDPGRGYVQVPKVIVEDPGNVGGGFMIVHPNPITGAMINPTTTASQFVVARISPVMGQGTPAEVSLTIGGGIVTGATVTDHGARYTQLPQILVFDPTGSGSGAVLKPNMGVGSIELTTGGIGFSSAPEVVLTPFFKVLFPDTSDQKAPFWQFLQTALQVGCLSPVTSKPPVLS